MIARIIVICCMVASITGDNGCGVDLGQFQNAQHGVMGRVFLIDKTTLFIKNFKYDGLGPATYFYVGYGNAPSSDGFIIPDEKGLTGVLMEYTGKGIVLTLPSEESFCTVKWFSVWCTQFNADFGHVIIPCNIEIPQPPILCPFMNTQHGVNSGDVIVTDDTHLFIPNFSYDGLAQDAHFFVGNGSMPTMYGRAIPDENGSDNPLRAYDCESICLKLPEGVTTNDFEWLSVWCLSDYINFGYVSLVADGCEIQT